MKGDKDVLAALNAALTNELTAINQYFLHARMYEDWGYEALGKHEYKESIEEMEHADKLIKRILMLGGLPNLQNLHKLRIGENVPECLQGDLDLELQGREAYVDSIQLCEKKRDFVSREILTSILDDTEDHIDYLETQLGMIDQMGLQNYLQTAAGPIEDS